jgi:hypothetical protein
VAVERAEEPRNLEPNSACNQLSMLTSLFKQASTLVCGIVFLLKSEDMLVTISAQLSSAQLSSAPVQVMTACSLYVSDCIVHGNTSVFLSGPHHERCNVMLNVKWIRDHRTIR